jgi:hypothetical protein
MKKLFQIALLGVGLTICLGACSKKNDNDPKTSASSSWSFGGTTYAAATTVFTNNSLLSIAKANSNETLGILFNAKPAAGTYTVVASNPGSNQCAIQATLGANQALLSENSGTVTVSNSNGKIHAVFSGVAMQSVTGTSEGNLSGDLTEQ